MSLPAAPRYPPLRLRYSENNASALLRKFKHLPRTFKKTPEREEDEEEEEEVNTTPFHSEAAGHTLWESSLVQRVQSAMPKLGFLITHVTQSWLSGGGGGLLREGYAVTFPAGDSSAALRVDQRGGRKLIAPCGKQSAASWHLSD
ncbi:hypothetical protein CCH79_00000664 [Gambusia affinis]|uniref:Uncharacterized protein n=1 Tax=Gambusia affinis TaxID=33528 RepID=A0A315VWQ0_GAMAF|nr:hypothetical protein CCH79_00000664 [Gambusia affinis]